VSEREIGRTPQRNKEKRKEGTEKVAKKMWESNRERKKISNNEMNREREKKLQWDGEREREGDKEREKKSQWDGER
jgi:hypothetical protein